MKAGQLNLFTFTNGAASSAYRRTEAVFLGPRHQILLLTASSPHPLAVLNEKHQTVFSSSSVGALTRPLRAQQTVLEDPCVQAGALNFAVADVLRVLLSLIWLCQSLEELHLP